MFSVICSMYIGIEVRGNFWCAASRKIHKLSPQYIFEIKGAWRLMLGVNFLGVNRRCGLYGFILLWFWHRYGDGVVLSSTRCRKGWKSTWSSSSFRQPLLLSWEHRGARLLKQQSSITVYCLPTKDNGPLCSVSCLQQTNRSLPFPFAANKRKFAVYIYRKRNYIFLCCSFKRKMESWSPGNFFSPFTIFSSCKWKFVHLLTKKQTEVICLKTD